jgi:hypothetical protein
MGPHRGAASGGGRVDRWSSSLRSPRKVGSAFHATAGGGRATAATAHWWRTRESANWGKGLATLNEYLRATISAMMGSI